MSDTILKFGKRTIKSSAAPVMRLMNAVSRVVGGASRQAGRAMILCYHRIVPDIATAERDGIFGLMTSTETFRRHLEIVREHCEVMTLEEAGNVLKGEKRTARPAVVVTFDDGYRDNYDQALPVLRDLGMPATVFVSTGLVGAQEPLHHDRIYWLITRAIKRGFDLREAFEGIGLRSVRVNELVAVKDPLRICDQIVYLPFMVREKLIAKLEAALGADYPPGYEMLTWEMIAEMEASGISFGAHSDQHPVLTMEDGDTIEREIRRSKRTLEDRLGHAAKHFAYPNGQYNQAIKNLVAKVGFDLAVTTERRIAEEGDDLHALARIGLCEESTRGMSGQYSEAVARMRLLT